MSGAFKSDGLRRSATRRDGVDGVFAHEIEPGRAVPNHWDSKHLVETWEQRKARRAAERQGAAR
jgi:hypothetical protein